MLQNRIPEIIAALNADVERAVKDGAILVMEAAKARVPRDEDEGAEVPHLRDAIHLERDRESGGWYVVAGNHDVFYGHMVEHGTVHSAPHPFLVPALEENREMIKAEIAAAMRRAVR